VHDISYGNAVVLFIITNAGAGIIRLGMIFAYAFIINGVNDVFYETDITNNTDGTITATFAYVHTETGIPRDICYVTLPEGWERSNEEMKQKIEVYIERDVPSNIIFSKNNETFLFFVYSLPIHITDTITGKNCKKVDDGEYWFEKGIVPDYNTYEISHVKNENSFLEACDSKINENKKTISRHVVHGGFVGTKMIFEMVYQSPAGEDEDLYFIINNIRCYNNY